MNMPRSQPGKTEFIALMGMTFATIAFSIDSMLPALPDIGQALTPRDLNRAQLVLTSFVLGMGIGTMFTGPLSDAIGRRKVLLAGFVLYIIGAILGMLAGSLEMLLAARVIQGLGSAGPRVVAMAIVRDLYAGRQMARLMSFVMMVFTLVPAIAPSMGAAIIALVGWRGMFGAFVLFALINSTWFILRQPETLPVDKRREFRPVKLWEGLREVLANPTVRITILVQTMVFGSLFGMLSSTQQVFDITFDRGASFPLWFGGVALAAGTASYVNSVLVVRLGMRRIVLITLFVQMLLSGSFALSIWFGLLSGNIYFGAFVLWMTSIFFMAGMTIGNLNAIAMEPMGHMAGMAASVTSAIFTVLAVSIAAPMGLAFDGTPLPLTIGVFLCATTGVMLIQLLIRRAP